MTCQRREAALGHPYPRTCPNCGLFGRSCIDDDGWLRDHGLREIVEARKARVQGAVPDAAALELAGLNHISLLPDRFVFYTQRGATTTASVEPVSDYAAFGGIEVDTDGRTRPKGWMGDDALSEAAGDKLAAAIQHDHKAAKDKVASEFAGGITYVELPLVTIDALLSGYLVTVRWNGKPDERHACTTWDGVVATVASMRLPGGL